jgi:hypothetical protein
MIVPLWVAELADAFWEFAGMDEPFPRGLRRPIARALPLAIISLPQLRLTHVRAWLEQNHIGCPGTAADRNLHACLVAWRGGGFVFLDGADPEDEQRLSLAHELAHFLRHYWHPRQQAVRKFGEGICEVLDGSRPPTTAERVHALLGSVPIGFHLHLLDRDPEGTVSDGTVRTAEREADRLAYELLAPAGEVLKRAGSHGEATLADRLRTEFGLPTEHAQRYCELLFPQAVVDPLLRRWGVD